MLTLILQKRCFHEISVKKSAKAQFGNVRNVSPFQNFREINLQYNSLLKKLL